MAGRIPIGLWAWFMMSLIGLMLTEQVLVEVTPIGQVLIYSGYACFFGLIIRKLL